MTAALRRSAIGIAAACTLFAACGGGSGPAAPTPSAATTTVRFEYRAPTALRADLSAAAQPCVRSVGATHMHPSWRQFLAFDLTALPPDRFEITMSDVPVGTLVSFRINDRNRCDDNPTGAVTANVFANGVALRYNTTTPGNGPEPGFAFTIAADGRITQ